MKISTFEEILLADERTVALSWCVLPVFFKALYKNRKLLWIFFFFFCLVVCIFFSPVLSVSLFLFFSPVHLGCSSADLSLQQSAGCLVTDLRNEWDKLDCCLMKDESHASLI